MKKFIFTAVLTLAFVAQSYAQSAYFLFDEGAKLTIANTDAKGKHTGYSTLEVKAGHGNISANVFASVCTMTTSVFYRQGLDIVSSDCQ